MPPRKSSKKTPSPAAKKSCTEVPSTSMKKNIKLDGVLMDVEIFEVEGNKVVERRGRMVEVVEIPGGGSAGFWTRRGCFTQAIRYGGHGNPKLWEQIGESLEDDETVTMVFTKEDCSPVTWKWVEGINSLSKAQENDSITIVFTKESCFATAKEVESLAPCVVKRVERGEWLE